MSTPMRIAGALKWRPYLGKYEVSHRGHVRITVSTNNGPAGRLLQPYINNNAAHYALTLLGGKQSSRSIGRIMREVWEVGGFALSPAEVESMRAQACAHNESIVPPAPKKPEAPRSPVRVAYKSSFRFEAMQTMVQGVDSWDDPRMDPMTSRIDAEGVWIDVVTDQKSERAA